MWNIDDWCTAKRVTINVNDLITPLPQFFHSSKTIEAFCISGKKQTLPCTRYQCPLYQVLNIRSLLITKKIEAAKVR